MNSWLDGEGKGGISYFCDSGAKKCAFCFLHHQRYGPCQLKVLYWNTIKRGWWLQLDLERLSLNNYDLFEESAGMSRMGTEMAAAFSRISATRSSFSLRVRHLSLSAVGGFNAAIHPYNDFIQTTKVGLTVYCLTRWYICLGIAFIGL